MATYQFSPSLGELTLYAFNLIGLRPTELTQNHMSAAKTAANLICSTWSAKGPNLWKVEQVTVPLVAGTAQYSYDPSIISILDAWISIPNGDGTYTDRYMIPISRSEYASYPEKSNPVDVPTVYWADRLLSPTITLWGVPDNSTYLLNYYAYQQIGDSALAGAQGMDLPLYFFEAFATALAARLAMMFSPEKAVALKAFADELYGIALDQNVEASSVFFSPQLSGYFRP